MECQFFIHVKPFKDLLQCFVDLGITSDFLRQLANVRVFVNQPSRTAVEYLPIWYFNYISRFDHLFCCPVLPDVLLSQRYDVRITQPRIAGQQESIAQNIFPMMRIIRIKGKIFQKVICIYAMLEGSHTARLPTLSRPAHCAYTASSTKLISSKLPLSPCVPERTSQYLTVLLVEGTIEI